MSPMEITIFYGLIGALIVGILLCAIGIFNKLRGAPPKRKKPTKETHYGEDGRVECMIFHNDPRSQEDMMQEILDTCIAQEKKDAVDE